MAQFTLHALKPSGDTAVLHYDNQTSVLTDVNGHPVMPVMAATRRRVAPVVSRQTPLAKTSPKTLKISLGLYCNYECEYCSQRFVSRADETNPNDISDFLAGLDEWVKTPPEKIEFWGGEPAGLYQDAAPAGRGYALALPPGDDEHHHQRVAAHAGDQRLD